MHCITHQILNQTFVFSANKTVYWQEKEILILSDLHLGKTTHFRKAGIAIPHQMFKTDLHQLWHCIQFFKPKKIIVVGDLFHSNNNKEHDLFVKWKKDISTPFVLVKGNHDILHKEWYAACGITVEEKGLTINEFAFVHDVEESNESDFTFCGHLHPGITIKSNARQSLRFPCFHLNENTCMLPAFGTFTGTASIKLLKKDTVFAIVENEVVQFQ
jgi:DNA ligase-associated metallophosphoesterase